MPYRENARPTTALQLAVADAPKSDLVLALNIVMFGLLLGTTLVCVALAALCLVLCFA